MHERSITVQFRSGQSFALRRVRAADLFRRVLDHVRETDRRSPCPLNGPDAVMLECDRELCFIAGQLLVLGVPVDVEAIRSQLVCWFDERHDGASSAAPQAQALSL